MAQFEIDIDLCLKDRRPFKITNESKILRRCVVASSLNELQWLSKSKLNLNPRSKVSIFIEKDGTEVDDQNFFEKLPYSREQKHVSISDYPRLLIEINSISNMGCQKLKIVRSLRYSGNTSCVCQVSLFFSSFGQQT